MRPPSAPSSPSVAALSLLLPRVDASSGGGSGGGGSGRDGGRCLRRHCGNNRPMFSVLVGLVTLFVLSGMLLGAHQLPDDAVTTTAAAAATAARENVTPPLQRGSQGDDVSVKVVVVAQREEARVSTVTDTQQENEAVAGLLPFGLVAKRASVASPEVLRSMHPQTLSICHPDWHGIRSAAHAFGDIVLEIPQLVNERHAERLTAFLRNASVELIVIHGIPPGMVEYATHLRRHQPNIAIHFVYHGTPALTLSEDEAILINRLIVACKKGIIDRLGFVKKGLAATFAQSGISTFELWNRPRFNPNLPILPHSRSNGERHIGIFGWNMIHKNLVPQLLAVCFLDNFVIHVQYLPKIEYLGHCHAKFVQHGLQPHDTFLNVVAQMDINLYVSLAEAFPMVVLESLSAGVPCLTSATSPIFDDSPLLRRHLVVEEHDNPVAILNAILNVFEHREQIALRIKQHINWLHRKSAFEWELFKLDDRSDRVAQRAELLKMFFDVHSTANEVTRGSAHDAGTPMGFGGNTVVEPISSALVWSRAQLRHEHTGFAAHAQKSIAFVTYELTGASPGGAGVVTSSIVADLVKSGYAVHVVTSMSKSSLLQWYDDMLTAIPSAQNLLHVHHLATVLAATGEDNQNAIVRSQSEFLLKSYEFALALAILHRRFHFERVELFEYAGVGYELLRARLETALQKTPTGIQSLLASRRDDREVSALPRPPLSNLSLGDGTATTTAPKAGGTHKHKTVNQLQYLPDSVLITLRIHGTLQLIDQSEKVIANVVGTTRRLMYLMERYCLETADILMMPSESMLDFYSSVYSLGKARMILAPPPMQDILRALRNPLTTLPTTQAIRRYKPPNVASSSNSTALCDPSTFNPQTTLLVIGRIQLVKGVDVIVQALTQLVFDFETTLRSFNGNSHAQLDPHERFARLQTVLGSLNIVFMGQDVFAPQTKTRASQYLLSLLPERLHSRIIFCPAVQRTLYLTMANRVRAAIVASEFETFNLVAHELAYVRIPLIVSDIPAFRPFFTSANSFVFTVGNSTSLRWAMEDALLNDTKIARLQSLASAGIVYGDPVAPYEHLPMPRTPQVWARLHPTLAMIEHEIALHMPLVDPPVSV